MIKQGLQFLVIAFAFASSFGNAFGQIELGTDKVACTFTIDQDGCEATITAKVVCDPHWHINSIVLPEGSFGFATIFKLDKSASYTTVGGVIEPKPHVELDALTDEMLSYHEGTFYIKRKIKVKSEKDFTIQGEFEFQTCDESKCLPPAKYEFSLKVKGCSEDIVEEAENIEETFKEVKGDEAKDKDGNAFVKVDGKWYRVPKGNSTEFYKKYLTLVGDDK